MLLEVDPAMLKPGCRALNLRFWGGGVTECIVNRLVKDYKA